MHSMDHMANREASDDSEAASANTEASANLSSQ